MPYRTPDGPREPASPDVDENLLRQPWSARALLSSLVCAPLVAWWLFWVEGGSGARQVAPHTKVAIAVAFALWLVVLLILRARHQRVLQAAVARMEQQTAQASRVRIADEPARATATVDFDFEREDDAPSDAKRRR